MKRYEKQNLENLNNIFHQLGIDKQKLHRQGCVHTDQEIEQQPEL